MWKYECKKHLIIVFLAMIVGAIYMTILGHNMFPLTDFITALETTGFVVDQQTALIIMDVINNPIFLGIVGAFSFGGIANGILLLVALARKFNINYYYALLIVLLLSNFILPIMDMIGCLLLIPTIVVCIYGWVTIPNREMRKNLKDSEKRPIDVIFDHYDAFYGYDCAYEKMGKKAALYQLLVYAFIAISFITLVLICVFVDNLLIIFIATILYLYLYYQFNAFKVKASEKITLLLYNECNPKGAISAIIAMSKALHLNNIALPQQMAQAFLYLEEPELAIDTLTYSKLGRKDGNIIYYELMAFAYYQLGDVSSVRQYLDLCNKKPSGGFGIKIINLMHVQACEAIKARLSMMEKSFASAKTFFATTIMNSRYICSRVEASYFLGLICFVDEEYLSSRKYFEYIIQHGGTMAYVEKAKNFIAKLDKIDVQ